jgi:hypothetical protein
LRITGVHNLRNQIIRKREINKLPVTRNKRTALTTFLVINKFKSPTKNNIKKACIGTKTNPKSLISMFLALNKKILKKFRLKRN